MTKFTISTEAYDATFEAASEADAILQYVREAGYETVADAADVLGKSEGEFVAGLIVTAVNDDFFGTALEDAATEPQDDWFGRRDMPVISYLRQFAPDPQDFSTGINAVLSLHNVLATDQTARVSVRTVRDIRADNIHPVRGDAISGEVADFLAEEQDDATLIVVVRG